MAHPKGQAIIGVFMTTMLGCAGGTGANRTDDPGGTGYVAEDEGDRRAGPALPRARPEVLVHRAEGEAVRVRVQVADERFERTRGLMYRRHLDPDAGMLFVFRAMEQVSFWMENTFIPLDVLFIDDALRIVGIVTNTVPLSQEPIEVAEPCQYVLEVNAGFVDTHHITPGSQIELLGVSLPRETP